MPPPTTCLFKELRGLMLGPMTIKPWREIDSKELLKSRIFTVNQSLSRSDLSGKESNFVQLDCPDWVNIVVLTEDEQVLMIRQWRHGTKEICLEIPGGMVDPDESPLEAARRELLEETGCEAESWQQIGMVKPNPAFQTNRCFSFLAKGAKKVAEQDPDENEEIEVLKMDLDSIPERIASGEIQHALVICAFFFAQMK